MKTGIQVPALNPLESLQTNNHSQLLDVVDGLRAQGLSNILPLPQLIVCGDQSSGKSSVLEAICGVPFPKKDNLCTRFATEVILRRDTNVENTKVHVSIRPGQNRSETDKQNLENFEHGLQNVNELPSAIQSAKDAMGLGSQGSNAFSTDVLRLEVTGKTMPQLTIVDLPGLIHSETKLQTAQDVELVSNLVQSYMVQSRSIILAVVSAKNDYANQIVLQRARKVDPKGQRTLGIITKPDTLHTGSSNERSFLELASNTDVVFKLGWHVIRNLDTNNLKTDNESRDVLEETFFQHSNWKKLGRQHLGIAALRDRLSDVLFDQITRELPHLVAEIEVCKDECQSALQRLGRKRETEAEQRMYLAELNQEIHDLCRAGCDGNYDSAFFRETDASLQPIAARRMRAVIQNQSIDFRRRVEYSGSRWQLSETSEVNQGRLTEEDAVGRVVGLLERSRGRELPGTFNPLLISELFREYSEPWEALSKQFVAEIWQSASHFLEGVLRSQTDEAVFENYRRLIVTPAMDEILSKANRALAVLLEERSRHAVTYNHDFTENVATQRKERNKKAVEGKLKALVTGGRITLAEAQIPWLANSVAEESESDMDRIAAQEIFEKMQSYYKVALERLIDNVPIHIIENIVIQQLHTVVLPTHAWKLSQEVIQAIAGESHAMRFYRQQLSEKVEILTKGEATCKRYAIHSELTPESSQTSETSSPQTSPESKLNDEVAIDAEHVEPVAVPEIDTSEGLDAGPSSGPEAFPEPAAANEDDIWGSIPRSSSKKVKKAKKYPSPYQDAPEEA